MKDQHTRMLHGRLLRPLKVGSSALIDHEGQFILTSLVTSIQVQNEQEAKFETLNTHYHVKFSPLQAAVFLLQRVAAGHFEKLPRESRLRLLPASGI